MKVTKDMLHPELRFRGALLKRLLPFMGERMIRFGNRFLERFAAGRVLSNKVSCEQIYIKRENGTLLRVCVYRPKEPKKDMTGLLWMHGGGYSIGIPEQDIGFIEGFILAADCVVIAPDYTRSIDAPYPAALDDCYSALLWMKENSAKLAIDCDRIMIGGDSAGGGLCAALSLLARDRGEVSIKYQMPLYPMIDCRETASSKDNDAPVWNSRSNDAAWKMYLGDAYGTERIEKYACPALETDYTGLPPTLTYVGSIEPFYDETLTYIENLKSAGVPVIYKVFEGCFHGFDITCGKTRVAKEARAFLFDHFTEAVKELSK